MKANIAMGTNESLENLSFSINEGKIGVAIPTKNALTIKLNRRAKPHFKSALKNLANLYLKYLYFKRFPTSSKLAFAKILTVPGIFWSHN